MSVFVALPIAFTIAGAGAVAMAVITGVRRGWEPDVVGNRARALFIYALAFAALGGAAFPRPGLGAAIAGIPLPSHGIINPTPGLGFSPGELSDKENTNEAVLAGLFAIAALLVFLFQFRRGNEALGEAGWLESPAGRIRRGYFYLASVVWVLIALFAGVFAAFGLYQIIVPGTAGLGGPHDVVRDHGIVQLASLGVLALWAVGVVFAHGARLPARAAAGAPTAGALSLAAPPPRRRPPRGQGQGRAAAGPGGCALRAPGSPEPGPGAWARPGGRPAAPPPRSAARRGSAASEPRRTSSWGRSGPAPGRKP